MTILKYVLLVIGSYFIGNLSFARMLSSAKKGDITKSGSGNPGTMNMLRTYGFKMALLTLVLDALKGAIPALIGLFLFNGDGEIAGKIGLYVGGLSSIVGHIYPVLYKFKGGKGIATTIGVFAVANPIWLLVFFVVAFGYLWFFDYGSIASLIVISALIIIEGMNYQSNLVISLLLFAIFFLTWFAHRKNITRLLIGKENKANLQKSIKKKTQKKQIKNAKDEYKQEKQNLKQEYKQELQESKENFKKTLIEAKETLKSSDASKDDVIKNFANQVDEFKSNKKASKTQYKTQVKDIKTDYKQEKKQIEKNLLDAVLRDIAKQQIIDDD